MHLLEYINFFFFTIAVETLCLLINSIEHCFAFDMHIQAMTSGYYVKYWLSPSVPLDSDRWT